MLSFSFFIQAGCNLYDSAFLPIYFTYIVNALRHFWSSSLLSHEQYGYYNHYFAEIFRDIDTGRSVIALHFWKNVECISLYYSNKSNKFFFSPTYNVFFKELTDKGSKIVQRKLENFRTIVERLKWFICFKMFKKSKILIWLLSFPVLLELNERMK